MINVFLITALFKSPCWNLTKAFHYCGPPCMLHFGSWKIINVYMNSFVSIFNLNIKVYECVILGMPKRLDYVNEM